MFTQLNEREKLILDILAEDAQTSILQLSEQLGVSQVTVRSDLSSLEGKGVILRVRGGALPAFHPEILEHQKNMTSEKKRIARAAADLVNDGDSIMLNDGTTTSLVPKFLLGKRDIRLVTNSALVLPFVRVNPSLNCMLIGGEFKASTEAIVGSQALSHLENYYVKYVFIGTGGFSAATGLTTELQEGAEIAKKMAGLGEHIVLLADSGKYGKKGFVNFLPMSSIDTVITDKNLESAAQDAIREQGTDLILV